MASEMFKALNGTAWPQNLVASHGVKLILHLLCLQPGQNVCGLTASQPPHAQQGSSILAVAMRQLTLPFLMS